MIGIRGHLRALPPRQVRMNGASRRGLGRRVANPVRTTGLAVHALVTAGLRTEGLASARGGGFYKPGWVLQDRECPNGPGEDVCGAELTHVVAFDQKRHASCCCETAAIPDL